jgi:hypothetical protein
MTPDGLNRRGFLGMMFGAACLPFLPRVTRHWVWISESDWRPNPNKLEFCASLAGLRSDGEWFQVIARIPFYDLTLAELERTKQIDIDNMRECLLSFTDCECREGFHCEEHP